MKRLKAVLAISLFAAGCAASQAQQAQDIIYLRGTVKAVKEGSAATIDKTSTAGLAIQAGETQFSIPYDKIKSFNFHEESQFHLGVLPAIAVGLFAPWAKLHFVTVTWTGEDDTPEVITLQAPKSTVQGLVEVMRARATVACQPDGHGYAAGCGTQIWN
jgi:hypothetical protein